MTGPSASGSGSGAPSRAGQAFPGTSNLNFVAGETVANLVVVGLGAGERVSLLNAAGAAHVIVDVTGYLTAGFNPVPGQRGLAHAAAQAPAGCASVMATHGAWPSWDRAACPTSGEPWSPRSTSPPPARRPPPSSPSTPRGSSRPLASNLNLTRGGKRFPTWS